MTAAHDYFEQVLALGHPPEYALAYTLQHYPDFVPGAQAPLASPQPDLNVEAAEPSPIKAYAAAALLLFGALLSVTAQFNHEWVVLDEEVNSLGLSAGLTTIRADCAEATPMGEFSQEDATDLCKRLAYLLFADDMEATWETPTTQNMSVDDLDDTFVGTHDLFCNNVESYSEDYQELLVVQWVYGGAPESEPMLFALASSEIICLGVGHDTSSDEQWGNNTRAGMVLWLSSIVALLGTGMLVTTAVGRELPGNIERHGRWTGFAAGGLMLAAMGSSGVFVGIASGSYGMGVWMTVLGGLAGIAAGVITLLDQK